MKTHIKKLVTHIRAHQDELCGLWQFREFGEHFFPGASTAEVQFIKSDWRRYPKDVIPLGIGFGKFDEHLENGGRILDTCSASLVAKELRTEDRLKDLLGEVLWCDTKPGVSPTQLANLIKAKHRVNNGGNQMGTLRWTYDAFDAICFGQCDKSFDIRADWNQFRESNDLTAEDHIIEKVVGNIIKADHQRNSFLTEIAWIAASMKQKIRQEWLNTAFRVMLRDAELFDQALKDLDTKARFVEIETKTTTEPLCILETDNEHVSAAFSQKAGLATMLISRNSVGQTCLFVSPRSSLPTTFLAAMIRMAEYEAWTGRQLSFEKACCEGTLKECPQWHLANRKVLLNGSLTHPNVPPSKLSLDTIANIASIVYVDEKRRDWIELHTLDTEKPLRDVVDLAFA